MIHLFLNEKLFIPDEYHKTIYDINYNKLYDSGFRLILIDLDNTIIPYDIDLPDEKIKNHFKKIEEIGFKIIIISNNKEGRIKKFSDALGYKYVFSAKKPFARGFKKAIKMTDFKNDKVVLIGDQLMTDVFGGKRIKLYVCLVDALKRSTEKWYTRMNRRIENRMIEKIKRKNINKYTELKLEEKK